MAKERDRQQQQQAGGSKKRTQTVGSTTSLGKRRRREQSAGSPRNTNTTNINNNTNNTTNTNTNKSTQQGGSQMRKSNDEYGSQASPFTRVSSNPKDLVKVTILGAAGGIGQPLSLLLMLHSEYIQHLALHDLADSIHGVGLDASHVDRQVKITTHMGQEGLIEAVKGARVIVIPAGLAQKPGMSRDDLFASNAEIMLNLAKTCATYAPEAMLAIITNPVNSLVPLVCEVYGRMCANKSHHHNHQQQQQPQAMPQATQTAAAAACPQTPPGQVQSPSHQQQQQQPGNASALSAMCPPANAVAAAVEQTVAKIATATGLSGQQQAATAAPREQTTKSEGKQQPGANSSHTLMFEESFRRIFGVTTLDVVRASTLTAKSIFYKNEPNGLFVDPSKIQVPVVGGHAGKTIMPLLSQATPKLDRERLQRERNSTLTLIESIQQAGIDVLNAKRGRGSATLAMAYAACRFTISLLRAQSGEQNIVECAYVRHPSAAYGDLEYFAMPLLLGKDGYIKSLGLGKPMAFEQQMLEEGARELKLSIVRGEDFARERLYADSTKQ